MRDYELKRQAHSQREFPANSENNREFCILAAPGGSTPADSMACGEKAGNETGKIADPVSAGALQGAATAPLCGAVVNFERSRCQPAGYWSPLTPRPRPCEGLPIFRHELCGRGTQSSSGENSSFITLTFLGCWEFRQDRLFAPSARVSPPSEREILPTICSCLGRHVLVHSRSRRSADTA